MSRSYEAEQYPSKRCVFGCQLDEWDVSDGVEILNWAFNLTRIRLEQTNSLLHRGYVM